MGPKYLCFAFSIGAAWALMHCSGGDGGGATSGDASALGGGGAEAAVGGGAGNGGTGNGGTGNGGTGNAGTGGGAGDATADGPSPPRCDPKKPFGTPTTLIANSFVIDQAARLSNDELTVYYASYGHDGYNGTLHLWTATRASASVAFDNPKQIVEVATNDGENFPTLTADGLTMYYQGTLGDGGYGIIRTTRASASAPWTNRTMLPGLTFNQIYVTPDDSRLYGMYNEQIYTVSLPYSSSAAPVLVQSGSPRVYWPVPSADELTLFFSWPAISPYQWELQVSTRTTTADSFGAATGVTELNTSADEHPSWVSADGCMMVFQRVNGSIPGNASGLLQVMRGL